MREGKAVTNVTMRMATKADAKEILDIYEPGLN